MRQGRESAARFSHMKEEFHSGLHEGSATPVLYILLSLREEEEEEER